MHPCFASTLKYPVLYEYRIKYLTLSFLSFFKIRLCSRFSYILFLVDIILKIPIARRCRTGHNINQKCPVVLNSESLLLVVKTGFFPLDSYGITNENNDPPDRVLSQVRHTQYIANVEHLSTHWSE